MKTAQADLFDGLAATRARDAAIDAGLRAAADAWKKRALIVAHQCARTMEFFTTDDVWRALELGSVGAGDPRALGGVMKMAMGRRWCVPTSTYQQSIRVACHSRPLRVWRSLLFTAACAV